MFEAVTIRSILELTVIGFIFVGLLNEDKLILWEHNVLRKIKSFIRKAAKKHV